MKHLNHINDYIPEFEMEDLEDYLQEFFDKFGIVKTSPTQIEFENPFNNYFVVKPNITPDNIGFRTISKFHSDVMYVGGINFKMEKLNRKGGVYTQQLLIDIYNNSDEINREFKRIKPNIEKRLGINLYHTSIKNNFFNRIKIW